MTHKSAFPLILLTLLILGAAACSDRVSRADSGQSVQAQPSPNATFVVPLPLDGSLSETITESYQDRLRGSIINPPRDVGDFTLPSTTGEDFTLSEHGGKIVMVYFGYLTCPDVCPTTMADMKRAYEAVGAPKDQVVSVFITIDPERDSLDIMKRYVNAFNPDFIGLRPESQEQLQDLLDRFGVLVKRREVDSALGYLLDHSASIRLIGPDGRVISEYPYGIPYEEVANDLQVMMDYLLPSGIAGGETVSASDLVPAHDPAREFRIVIPEGTGTQIAMGQDPGIIPLKIYLTLGVQDILVLENHDNTDYLVGGLWVAPFETVSKQFYEPQSFVGLCTVTVGRDLVEIVVAEP
ncbi:MAG: SCO family protein [Anaerolineae bacterium]|nr:SCO family protein [Anaerolineae bacterium]